MHRKVSTKRVLNSAEKVYMNKNVVTEMKSVLLHLTRAGELKDCVLFEKKLPINYRVLASDVYIRPFKSLSIDVL